ncbi:MAG TPA: hypothetical protein VLA55_05795 [Ornithinibacter sp.]|nr:hypothetical protein [Ornithinibacter sp.]
MPLSITPVWRGLIDDAAMFPPGNATLPDAVARHRVHRTSAYAPCIGPLLVPAASAGDLLSVLDREPGVAAGMDEARPASEPLAIVLIARPGADPALLTAGLDTLRDDARVKVVGAELGWYAGWYTDLAGGLALAVEIPRGPDHDLAFAEVRTAHGEGLPVVAKFRTGPTPAWAWPDEHELADFLRLVAREAPFKLTGGLHHAARGTYEVEGRPEENHGVLNILFATSAALDGAGHDEVAGLLALRDAQSLAALVASWPESTATRVRTAFTAYGCCTVTDPIDELTALRLLTKD